jgi:MarR-like DNA-binding transcriptional regulator SgrR of sgrS sRNA
MAEQLKAALAKSGCELTVIFYDAKSWNGCTDLPQADLFMGDRLIGEMPEYALEQWLRCDALWPALFTDAQARHVQNALDETQAEPDDEQRIAALKHLFTHLMRDAILTPLFNYQYQVSAPPGVNGIHLNARGWFDFSEAWLPPATR